MLDYIIFLLSLFKYPVSFDYGHLNIKVPHAEIFQIASSILRFF